MQFLSEGRYVANVVDGKVTLYGGRAGTSRRIHSRRFAPISIGKRRIWSPLVLPLQSFTCRSELSSRELPVDPDCDHRWGFPCCFWSLLPACRRQYPGRSDGTCSLVRSINIGLPSITSGSTPASLVSGLAQRSPTVVTAYMLAKSPWRPSTPEAPTALLPPPPLRLLPGGTNQLPGERTSSRAGLSPAVDQRFSRRTVNSR